MHLKWGIIWWHTCISHRLQVKCSILRLQRLRNNNTPNISSKLTCTNINNNNTCSTNTNRKFLMEQF